MSKFNVNHITGKQGQQGTVLAGVTTVSSTGSMRFPSGPTEQRGGRGRGVLAGGYMAPALSASYFLMNVVEISTLGNATEFGYLAQNRGVEDYMSGAGVVSSSTRGVVAGGSVQPSPGGVYTMQYYNFSSSGGTSDFGGVLKQQTHWMAGFSDGVRGVTAGGLGPSNVMEYITIAVNGDATDFGDLTTACRLPSAASSPTRGIIFSGNNPGLLNNIDYATIATTGNAQDFGEMIVTTNTSASCASPTRAVTGHGYTTGGGSTNVMQYVTIASKGNTTDFGDLHRQAAAAASFSNHTRGIFNGGYTTPAGATVTRMDYITIATTGNAADFGDTTIDGYRNHTGGSDSHGGIGG